MTLTLSLTLEEQILAAIPTAGTTWEALMEHLHTTDALALQKCVRHLKQTGVITIEPDLLVRSAHITKTVYQGMDVAADVHEAIPPCGITFGDLKVALPPEEHEGELVAKLVALRASGLILITPKQLLNDNSVIERITQDDKVVAFKSRQKTA